MSVLRDGKKSQSFEDGSVRAAKDSDSLLDQSDSGSVDAAFRLAQTYSPGLLARKNDALAARFAENARKREFCNPANAYIQRLVSPEMFEMPAKARDASRRRFRSVD